MDEDVAAVVVGEKAEALLRVVPLDLAGRHRRPRQTCGGKMLATPPGRRPRPDGTALHRRRIGPSEAPSFSPGATPWRQHPQEAGNVERMTADLSEPKSARGPASLADALRSLDDA